MVGNTSGPLSEHGRRRNYGTMRSDGSSETETSQSNQEPGKPAQTAKWCKCCTMFALIIIIIIGVLALVWPWSSLGSHDDSTVTLSLPSISPSHENGQRRRYLWLIDHGKNADHSGLAQMCLYANDNLTTETYHGGALTIDTLTWNLGRSFNHSILAFNDIFQNPKVYSALLKADLIFCEFVPTSRSEQCRLVSRSFCDHGVKRPLLEAFDLDPDFDLCRPRIQQKHKLRPYVSADTNTDGTEFTATVHKSSLKRSVECPKILAFARGRSTSKDDSNTPMSSTRGVDIANNAVAPGFYIIPDLHLLEHHRGRQAKRLGDTAEDEDVHKDFNTPTSATEATKTTSIFPDRHATCTLSERWNFWGGSCHGDAQRSHVAKPPTSTPLASIPRRAPRALDPDEEDLPKHPLLGLWVAIGMLALFLGLALAGALTRRHLARRTRPIATRAARSEELEEPSAGGINAPPRYVRLLQRVQAMYARGKGIADRFTANKSKSKDVQADNSPRKLQKTKGTRFENPTDFSFQAVSHPLAVPIQRPIDQDSVIEERADSGVDDHIEQATAETNEGTSTAQEHNSRNAPTRRSNRSTSVQDEDL